MGLVRSWCQQHYEKHGRSAVCVLCALAVDIAAVTTSTEVRIHTPQVAKTRQTWAPQFNGFQQQDAAECYVALADACNEVDISTHELLSGSLLDSRSARLTTPFWNIFGMRGRTDTECTICGQTSTTYWMESLLHLTLPPGREVSLQACLTKYFAWHSADDRNDKCQDRCQRQDCRRKCETVDLWPQALTFHLKRWIPTAIPHAFIKEQRMVHFPFRLDANTLPRYSGSPYSFRSVIVHDGDPGGGHYTCYARDTSDRWHFYDDAKKPRTCSPQVVAAACAYMLVYEKAPSTAS